MERSLRLINFLEGKKKKKEIFEDVFKHAEPKMGKKLKREKIINGWKLLKKKIKDLK